MGETAKLHLDLEALIGSTIHDRYQVETLLGSGGMGAVFKARHTGLQRGVAIKVLHPEIGRDPSVSKRFDREAHSASRLDHPNCVRVTDFGTTENGTKYLVMELLEGGDLDGRLGQPWPPARAVATIEQVLHGLEHAHHVGIVHRDLKPENIFVTKDFRGEEVIKIVDFGIAKLIDEQGTEKLTRQGIVFGTPRYMSPEQAAGGKIDERTDLYAVGLILYELLAGHPPFQTDDAAQLLRMHIMAPPPPLPAGVPEPLAKIVDKLLEKAKSDRFASAREVLDALAQIEGSLALAVVTPPASATPASAASSGVAWQPAPEPGPVVRGGTLVAQTGELAAVSLAAARTITRTGSHAGVGQAATGSYPSLGESSYISESHISESHLSESHLSESHLGVTEPSATHPSRSHGSSSSLAGVSMSAQQPAADRPSRSLPIVLAGVVLLLVLVGVGVMLSSSDDDPTHPTDPTESGTPPATTTEPAPATVAAGEDPIAQPQPDTSVSPGPIREASRTSSRSVRPSSKSEAETSDDSSNAATDQPGGPTDSTAPPTPPAKDEVDAREPERESEADAEQQTQEPDKPESKGRDDKADRDKGRGNGKGHDKKKDD